MSRVLGGQFNLHIGRVRRTIGSRSTALIALLLVGSTAALAQGGSPFDTGFTAIQTLFTGRWRKSQVSSPLLSEATVLRTESQAPKRRSQASRPVPVSQCLL